jgi:beta-N-acetylhexosaminidase
LRLRLAFLSLVVLVGLDPCFSRPARAQTAAPPSSAQALLDSLSPEEKVGQLFLVSFAGTSTEPGSSIHALIATHHVGGVVLTRANDNFVSPPQTLSAARDLIARLQRLEWDSADANLSPQAGSESSPSHYVPLLVGISQAGNGEPNDQILSGLTAVPSAMALGATWDPALADQIGQIQGSELAGLGFNLYLGPSLDVLDSPNPVASGDPGVASFGGDPYWVGQMARAYTQGLHTGSRGGMLVVGKHFPGGGGSDRRSEDEVSTVRKSLEQLQQIELAPFFVVTSSAPGTAGSVDGLLVSHIRYQGFQGNIRATTRPVSLDPQALGAILGLPQLQGWREGGGVTVSDELGTRAVHDFYAAAGAVFSARTVAKEAFLAGNDLLVLGNITASDGATNPHETAVQILEFFAQKYREDAAFAQRVDDSVLRILTAKLRLYPSSSISRVTPEAFGIQAIGNQTQATFDVARRAATLVSPTPQELTTVLPSPPQVRERLVFITDTVPVGQCSTCPALATPPVDLLQNAVLGLYGPQGANQTSNFRVSSYALDTLRSLLDGEQPAYLEADLDRADWVILSITAASEGQPELVSRFLGERQDLLPDKNVVLFSFGPPYYFDATDISRLTAYFALYSKQPPFFDIAARLLFQELAPMGASPVSIAGTSYDLISAMTPDPAQIITLALDLRPDVQPTGQALTPEPTAVPFFTIGDTIAVRTGPIRDHNARPVPDGTVVQFSMTLIGEGGGILQQVDAVTIQGVARASFGLDKPGLLEIRASSEPAMVSEVLQMDVSQSGAVAVTVVVPQLTVTSPGSTPASPVAAPETGFISVQGRPKLGAWLVSMFFLLVGASLAFWFADRAGSGRSGLRFALGVLVGGLLAYNYVVLGLPGTAGWLASSGLGGLFAALMLGEAVGLVAGWAWSRIQ